MVFPEPAPPALTQALALASYTWKAVGSLRTKPRTPSPMTAGPVVSSAPTSNPTPPSPCAGRCANGTSLSPPCCCCCRRSNSVPSSCEKTSSTTSASTPCDPRELEARLSHLFWRTGRGLRPELVEYGPLVLNLETYQASVAGRPLSLTFMEYELLKFLATHPGKVFTRETLLSRVWGYEYYGGATHGRRPRPPPAGQARRGARQPHIDGAVGRLPLRPEPLGAL